MGLGFAPDLMAGRVAVLTGGGGAICGEAACMLAAAGCEVVVADIDADRLAAVAARVRAETGRVALTVAGDLRTAEGMEALASAAFERHQRVDVLVNGLGEHLASAGPHEDGAEEVWQALYEVNLLHVFRATKAFVPAMKRQGWGRIVNFSSVEGARAAPALAVYAAFKRGVDGFTRSLAVDLARHGILVNAVAVDKTRAHQVGRYELPEEYARLAHTWVPAGRYGEPADVASIVVFLASPLNTWIVGDTVNADGGTLAAGGWLRTPARWTNQPLLVQYLEDPDVNAARPPAVQ
ncbi:SDR family NAD(P)-dependent oxidoreductase [Dactylosporangium sp. CS-033363]|uniref:SDR family NAD(P)-dependent oxidoreductase n=1 Tax=Dactylosporangium sp. CS-033363 TaxID=3239935 RepID=UPI003D94B693